MSLHLSDLDELLLNVRNSNTKSFLNEAIISYRAGSYRASIITTWISVCVDIIEKIKELSIGNDVVWFKGMLTMLYIKNKESSGKE